MKFTFELTADEANLVMAGLGKLPFEAVFNLVSKIQQQAQEQSAPSTAVDADAA